MTRISGWAVFCTCAALILASVTGVSGTVLLDRVVAIVNNDVITWGELYKAMDVDASPQLKELKDEERRRIYKENEEVFLENLINMKLQLQEAKNLGIGVNDEEVREAVESIKKKYTLNDEAFRESLKKEGYTLEEYKKRLKEQITIGKVVNQQVRSKVLVTPEDMNRFIQQGHEDSEGYRIRQIFFRKPEKPEDRQKAEEKAEAILKKLKQGESFVELAQKFSEDSSASEGGDLGFISKENLLREFRDVVSPMKAGDVSEPFWTARGLHIIRVEERKESRSPAEMKDEAEKRASEKVFLERYNAWIKSLREKSFIEVKL